MVTLRTLSPPAGVVPAPASAGPTPVPAGTPGPAERVALRRGPSAIAGEGVFAAQAVGARAKLGEIRGEAVPAASAWRRAREREAAGEPLYLLALSERRVLDATATPGLLRHVNHACEPNAFLRWQQGRLEVVALRDLAEGEEVTVDYGPTHHAGRLACRCGSPRCRGRL